LKIDFHCHTKKTKSDESELRNVTPELFKEKIVLSGVKIVAITNHNCFDVKQYTELKNIVKDYCQVWPGIELDVKGNSNIVGHMILIANPDDAELFSKKMNEILNGFTPDNFIIKLSDLYDQTKNLNLVYVVHCFKKKELPLSDIEAFGKILDNPKRLFKEPSSLTSITVLQSNKHRVIVGTDVINWNNYENYNFGEFKFELKNFSSFIKIIEKDLTFLKDIVNEELSENVLVYGKQSTKEFPFTIPVYNDVNIIFGDKGSGKSEILNSLLNYYTVEKNEEPVYYQGGDQEKWYNNLVKNNDEDYNIKYFNLDDNMETEFKQISSFKDTNPVPLKKYIDYFKYQTKKNSKDKMKCLLIQKEHLYLKESYEKKYNEYKKIVSFKKEYNAFNIKNKLSDEEQTALNNLIDKLITLSYDEAVNEWFIQQSKYLFDDFATKIPIYVSENVGEPAPPSETGFANFAKNRLETGKNAINILNILNNKTGNETSYIGSLGSKGNVLLSTKYEFYNLTNASLIDSKNIKCTKTSLKDIITKLNNIKNKFSYGEISQDILQIKQYYDSGINSIISFISVKKEFTINGKGYRPSKGENSILSLQHELLSKKEKNIFLIDEPDLSLGSTYINEVIVPLFKDLSKSKKILVIATHDANIAVRTRPLNSILKLTDNNIYKTYIGNMFTDCLINIDNKDDVLSWREQSIKYLEGGEAAFSERGDLYE
jgi:ABC-type lipoprotein export system ATPase subunit